jgi:adenine-specific DNA-methyltransferase
MIDKLDMFSPDIVNQNIDKIAALFPNCITETANGRAIDFDLLKQELNHDIVEGTKERYRLEWPGKREAIVTANLPSTKTLRPIREDSVDFDKTENVYIEGDNLEVLKLLQESYLGKIKMIYIDPPYNTGNDFIYNDDFSKDNKEFLQESGDIDEIGKRLFQNPDTSGRYHSDWISMMYPRLKLARNLLRDDGVIFISIDDNEIINLRKLCDEIFGEQSFVEQIIWKNKYGAGAKTKGFIGVHEYILCYSKTNLSNLDSPLSEEDIKKYKHKDEKFLTRGGYITQPLATTSMGDRPNLVYPIQYNDEEIWPNKQWVWAKERLYKAIDNNEVVIKQMPDGNYSVRSKQYVKDEFGNYRKGKPISIMNGPFNQDGTKEISGLFDGKSIFDFPKPSSLPKYFFSFDINDVNDKEAIILDFFSGSSTTAHAVMKLNSEDKGKRKFIMVQLPETISNNSQAFNAGFENICEIGKERIRRVGNNLQLELKSNKDKKDGELNLDTDNDNEYDLDTGFRVYRLDESNMQDVYYKPQEYQQGQLDVFADNVKPDRTADDLLAQVMLDWGLQLSLKIETLTISGKNVFNVAQNSLLACFDSAIDETFAKEIAKYKALRIVFKDSSFKDDSAKENIKQLLKQLSPETEMKVI